MRALAGAIAIGSGAGLIIGAAYLAGGAGKPAPNPVPAVSGPLQAVARPAGGDKASVKLAARSPLARPSARMGEPLRDRFRMASAAFQAAAQPFRFRQVADAPSDLHCLTEAVYFEARGEAQAGQQAVAQVVLNRVRHPAFPKTICAVVHQHAGSGCQFSFACSSRQAAVNSVAWRRAEAIASSEMHGAVMSAVGDATHFQAAHASPFAGLLKVAQIGAHIFYRFGGHAGASGMFHQTPGVSGEPAKMEVAGLEAAPASRAAQAVAPDGRTADGRIKVTLYPVSTSAGQTPAKPEAMAVKLSSPTPPDAVAASSAVPRSVPTLPATPAAKSTDAPAVKPAVISVALAQS